MAEYEKEVSAQGEYKVERKEEVHHGGILHHNGVEFKEEVKIQQHHGEEYKEEAHKHGAGILGVFKKHEEEGYSGDEVKIQHKEEVKQHHGPFHHGVVEFKEEVKVDHKHGDEYEHEKQHGGILGVFKKHEHGGEVEHHDSSAYEHKHVEKEHHGHHHESKSEVDEVKYKVNDEDELKAY